MSDADKVRSNLGAVVSELAELDARRANLMLERDALMAAARDSGVTWAELERVTGLSRPAVKKSLDRMAGK